jgi:hypothetical protein
MDTITVTVNRVNIPALSTIGQGEGTTPDGRLVRFAGDHRPMRHLAEALAAGESVTVHLEPWQVLYTGPLPADSTEETLP